MLMSKGQMLLAHFVYNVIGQMLLSQFCLFVMVVHDVTDKDIILHKIHLTEKWSDLQIQVCRVDGEEEYIGETGRTFAERFREHMRALSSIHDITTPLVMNCLWTISA